MGESSSETHQVDKFKAAAREAQADMDEEAFDQALKKVAKPPPETDEKPEDDKPGK